MFELIDRRLEKQAAAEVLRNAQVPAMAMTALYLALVMVLNMIDVFSGGGILHYFITIFTELLASVLTAGFVLYCMAIRRQERAEYLTLFDGFSLAGKIIGLLLLEGLFIGLWSMLFVIPGVIAMYRYSFALYNLLENPDIGVFEALDMSKRQTIGYKSQLFTLELSYLGWRILSLLPAYVAYFMTYHYFYVQGNNTLSYFLLDPVVYLGIPLWAWQLIQSLWQLAVSLFFLANYRCTHLAYFETAKRTSGIGKGAAPRNDGPWDLGPDGLGGL